MCSTWIVLCSSAEARLHSWRIWWWSAPSAAIRWVVISGKPAVICQAWRSWNADDTGNPQGSLPDGGQRRAARRRLHEDVHRVAQEQQRARHHQEDDRERGDSVGVVAAGRDHHQGGHDRGDRADGVAEDVEKDAAGCETGVLRTHD